MCMVRTSTCSCRRFWLSTFIIISGLAAAIFQLPSCRSIESDTAEYDRYVDRAADIWQFQGSYLVARGDSIVVRGSRGPASVTENRLNAPATGFLIGSMTKSFTAVAVLQLAEQGLIDLDENITAYISDYPTTEENPITVHDLLCHRSGIPDVVNNREFVARLGDSLAPREIVAYFRDQPLDFRPGTRYAYSSSNYILLGLIIEATSGLPWEDYIQRYICRPAGLENTGVFYDYSVRDDFARGYIPDMTGSLMLGPTIHPSIGYAAGALASTVDDLYRFNLALSDTTLLTPYSVEQMLTPHSPTYGYGWLVDDFGGHRLAAHGGGVPGFVSIMQRWLDDSVFVVVLSNNVAVPAHAVANGLAAIALGEPYELPRKKNPIPMTTQQLREYEGDYKLGDGEYRHVRVGEGKLLARRSSGPALELLPEDTDRFYFARDHHTTLAFLRDPNGSVIGHVIGQAFDQDTAWRADD